MRTEFNNEPFGLQNIQKCKIVLPIFQESKVTFADVKNHKIFKPEKLQELVHLTYIIHSSFGSHFKMTV